MPQRIAVTSGKKRKVGADIRRRGAKGTSAPMAFEPDRDKNGEHCNIQILANRLTKCRTSTRRFTVPPLIVRGSSVSFPGRRMTADCSPPRQRRRKNDRHGSNQGKMVRGGGQSHCGGNCAEVAETRCNGNTGVFRARPYRLRVHNRQSPGHCVRP